MPNPLIQAIIQGAPVQVGLEGAPIRIEMKAPQGPAGPAGPNSVTSTTTTNFTAGNVLSSNGTTVTSLSRSGIDTRTSFPNDDVTNATTTGAADQLLRLNAGGNAVANVFIATEGVEAGEEGGDSGYFRINNTSGDAVTINNANASNAEVSFPTGSGTLALTSSADGSLSSTDITDFVTAVEAVAPNEVTSATTSDGTATLLVETISANNPASNALIGSSTVGNGLAATSDNGYGADIASNNNIGAVISSSQSTSLQLNTVAGNYYLECQNNYTTFECAIERIRGWFVWFYNTFTGRLKTDDITDNREWTLPDRTGSIALTEDYTAGTAVIDVLTATVQGTLTANHIHGNLAGALYAHIRAGENLAKGDPVYVSGFHAGTGYAIVSKADASNAAKMPAIGVMDAAVLNNANGHMVITGTISDLDTNAYAVNSVLYVASGGGWTNTPPAANSQPVAIVERSNTNNGAVIVKVNDLASYGGTGVDDANKLVRFNPFGGITANDITSTGAIFVSNYDYNKQATFNSPLDDGNWQIQVPSKDGTLVLSSDFGTNVATFLATPTSENLAAAVTNETGSGSLVFADLPTLNSPTLNNIPEATLAAIATLTGQTGAPPVVLFDDFYGSGNTTVGMWTWADGTTGTAGTGSTDAGNTANGSSQYAGMCRINTAAVSGNGRIRFLNIGSSGKMIGTQWRACFAIPDITNVRITIGGQGGGGAYELRYDSSANSGQWVLAIAVNSVYTIYTFTSATALAGDFQSGKRYRMSLTRTSTTLCTLVLEIADYNLANWSDVFRGTITHLAHFENLQAWQPMFTVTALEAVVKRLCVDWISVYNPNILR